MPRLASLAALLCLALPPAAAHADAAKPKVPKVALLDFPPEKSFDENTNRALNEFYATDLRQQGLQVISSADMAAALGLERQRQLLGCGESNCMAELGGALGADYIARGTVAVIGTITALTLSLQDTRGQEINRVAVRVPGRDPAVLLEKLDELVPQLVQPLRDAHRLPPAASAPARPQHATAASTAPVAPVGPEQPAAGEHRSNVLSYVLIGVGGAAALGGGALLGVGVNDLQHWKASDNHIAGAPILGPAELDSAHQGANREITGGSLLAAAGVVAAGAGVALLLSSGGDEPKQAAREPDHHPGLVALLLDF